MVRNPEDPARQRGRSADAVGLFEDEGRLAGIRRRDRCEHRSTAAADDDEIGALVPVLAHAPYTFSMKRSDVRRVGKAYISTCRSRWSLLHYKKKSKSLIN